MRVVHIMGSNERRNKHSDDHIMSMISGTDFNYLLGLLITDGCISNPSTAYSVHISLEEKSVDVLYKLHKKYGGILNKFIKSTPEDKGSEFFEWNILSIQFHKFLNSIGITHNKTFTVNINEYWNNLKYEDRCALLRGMIDGDGSISILKNSSNIMIGIIQFGTSSVHIYNMIKSFIPNCRYSSRILPNGTKFYTIGVHGEYTSRVLSMMYDDGRGHDLHIEYKYIIAKIIQEFYNQRLSHTNICRFTDGINIYTVPRKDLQLTVSDILKDNISIWNIQKFLSTKILRNLKLLWVKPHGLIITEQLSTKYSDIFNNRFNKKPQLLERLK